MLMRGPREEKHELVAAISEKHVRISSGGLNPGYKLGQGRVTASVAEGVIDALEMIKIQKQNGEGIAISLATMHLLLESFQKGDLRIDAGQRVSNHQSRRSARFPNWRLGHAWTIFNMGAAPENLSKPLGENRNDLGLIRKVAPGKADLWRFLDIRPPDCSTSPLQPLKRTRSAALPVQ